jgi:transposase InsO family protein
VTTRDNALAEPVIGLLKTERHSQMVDWHNHRRLLAPIGDTPLAEAEVRYYEQLEPAALAA